MEKNQKELSTITTKFKKQKINPEEAFNNYQKKITEGRHQGDVPLPSTVEDLQYELDFLTRSAQDLSRASKEEMRRLGVLDKKGEVNFAEYLKRQLKEATGRTTQSLAESYHRASVRPFLIKQHEAGKIKLSDEHYKQLKEAADLNTGGSNRLKVVDPVAVFKYHYGEKALDKIPAGLTDANVYTKDGTKELVKMFEDAGITVKNKASAGDASKYLSKDKIHKEIERIDDAMENIMYGDDPFWSKMTDAEKQHTIADLERQSMAYQDVLSIADLPREVKLRSLLEEGKKVKWRNQTNLKEFDLTILETGNPTDEHIDFLYELLFRPKKFDPTSNKHIAMREEILENLPDVYTKADLENAGNIEGLYYDHVHAGDIKNNQGLGSIDQKVSGSVTIDTITPKTPKKKSEFEVISGDSEKGKEIAEKLGITARPGFPIKESGKPDLKLVKASTADEIHRAKLKKKLMESSDFKNTSLTDADMDFSLQDVKAGDSAEVALAKAQKRAKEIDARKEKEAMDKAWKEATEGMPTSGSIDDLKKWLKEKETKSLVKTTKKKDRPNIRLMKNYEKELTDIELAQEGYNLQEIGIIKRAREVMKKENQNPDDALAWVRGEMADEAGVEFEEFMTDFDWGDFPGKDEFATGGRVGLHRGSLRHQKTHDYKAYQKPGDILRQSPPENWLAWLLRQKKIGPYNEQRDAMESFMKERFMYGEKKQPLNLPFTNLGKSKLDKKINAWIKELFTEKKADGGRVGYQAGTHPLVPAELSSMLVRLRNVVEGNGMYANFSQKNRKSLQISLTGQINALLGN